MRHRSLLATILVAVLVMSVVTAGILPAFSETAVSAEPSQPQVDLGVSAPGLNPITLIASDDPGGYRLPVPDWATGQRVQSASIVINYIAAGSTNALGDTCQAWPAGSQSAFSYAATIWGAALNSTVPIKINACWASLGTGVLGHSATTSLLRDFSGAPRSGTWYAVALANSIAGVDINNSDGVDDDGDGLDADSEMEIAYSDNGINWYFGTDQNPGALQYDFVSVVLHEIAHGLGFAGTMRVSSGIGSWGYGSAYPGIYDRFTENGSGQSLISAFSNNSSALASQLTSGNIYFDGTNANAANGGSTPKLYAPATWAQGSSYAHLDYATYKNTVNALMVYAISKDTAIHNPGPVTMGILKDVGWTTNVGPVITSLNPSTAVQGSGAFTLIVQGTGFEATSSVRWNGSARTTTYVSATELRASIPASDIVSAGTAQVTVANSGGLVSSPAQFIISLAGGTHKAYLPLLSKNPVPTPPPSSGPTPGFWKSSTGDEFYVNPASTYIKRFAIIISVPACGTYRITHLIDEPITNGQFSFSGPFSASGNFDSATAAHGQDQLTSFYISGCGTVNGGPWNYNATWQNSTQPTVVQGSVVGPEIAAETVLEGTPAGYEVTKLN